MGTALHETAWLGTEMTGVVEILLICTPVWAITLTLGNDVKATLLPPCAKETQEQDW